MNTPQPLAEWLYLVESDVDPPVQEAWNRWYDEVHVPEMLACPGWLWGERYVTEGDSGRTFITIYGMSGPEALESPEFEERRGWGEFGSRLRYTAKLYRRSATGTDVDAAA